MFGTREPRTTVVTDRAQLGAALANADRIIVEGPPELLNFALGCAEREAGGRTGTAFRARVDVPPGEVVAEGRARASRSAGGLSGRTIILLGVAAPCAVAASLALWSYVHQVGAPRPETRQAIPINGDPQPSHVLQQGTAAGSTVDMSAIEEAARQQMARNVPDAPPPPAPPLPPLPNASPPLEQASQEVDAPRNDTAPTPRSRPTAHRAPLSVEQPEARDAATSSTPLQTVLQTSAWPVVAVTAILCLFVLVLVALRTNRNVELVWKVTEKFEGRVVITKVRTPRARAGTA